MATNIIPAAIESLTLEVEGATFEVSSYTAQFAINEIPSCTVDLAIGVNAADQSLAEVHGSGDSLLLRSKATVTLSITGKKNLQDSWPGGGVIFEGYVHSVQPTRSTRQVGVRVTLYHWLSDLNTSHFGFGRLAPSTPWNIFKERPSINQYGFASGLHRGPKTSDFIRPDEIFEGDIYELFKEGLMFSLTDTTSVDLFRTVDGVKPEAFHDDAEAALERIENLGCIIKASAGPGSDSHPLDPQQINRIMGEIAHNSAGGSTAWSKILAFCNLFDLQIIPAVEDVYIAPRLSGATDPGVEISNTEIDLGGGSGFQTNLPRGVAMLPTKAPFYKYGLIPAGCEGLNTLLLGQYVIPPNAGGTNLVGAIEVIPAPPIFSAEFMMMPTDAAGSSGPSTQQQPDSEPILGFRPGEPDCPPTNVFADDWCEAYYWNYVYTNRVQNIDSALRFDTTPGTIVKVDISQASAGASAVGNIPGYAGNTIYGMAERIVYQISAEEKKMSTQIVVRYIKSEEDKKIYDSTSNSNKHPLFETFYGTSSLVKPLQNTLGA